MPIFALNNVPHSLIGEVGSSSNIPSFNSSSGLGRCCSFCSKLSARICFCNSFCWPTIAGAAVESGRMFPTNSFNVSELLCGPRAEKTLEVHWVIESHVQSVPPSPDASPTPSSNCPWLVGAPVLAASIVSLCLLVSFPNPNIPSSLTGCGCGCVYGAAFVSRRMFLFLRSCASGRICRCFSRDSWRSMGERGVSSKEGGVFSSVMVKVDV